MGGAVLGGAVLGGAVLGGAVLGGAILRGTTNSDRAGNSPLFCTCTRTPFSFPGLLCPSL